MKIKFSHTVLLSMALIISCCQLAVADKGTSTLIKPLTNPKINTPASVNTTKAEHMENIQYTALPTCPTNPLCPDINGRYPQGGSAKTCPDNCTVTRIVEQIQIGGVTRVTRVVPPVCPFNYVKITEYNMQNEIKYDSNPKPTPPITSFEDLAAYRAKGFNCTLDYNSPHATTYCSLSEGLAPPETHNDPNIRWQEDAFINGYIGKYLSSTNSGCLTRVVGCDGLPIDCKFIHSKKYTNFFYHYICKPPQGFYYTNNVTPASTVCTSHLPRWKTN